MRCPKCSSNKVKVVDTRALTETVIKRRRECQACGVRFNTYEEYAPQPYKEPKAPKTYRAEPSALEHTWRP